jgi:hypothetical protein
MADNNAIALGIKVPDAMQSLGAVLGNANAAQQYKAGQVDLARKQATMQADIERAKAESSLAGTNANVAARSADANVTQANEGAKQAQIATKKSQWVLDSEQAKVGHEQIGGLLADPSVVAATKAKTPEEMDEASRGAVKAVRDAKERMINLGISPERADVIVAPFLATAAHAPQNLYNSIKPVVLGGQAASTQSSTVAPPVALVNNGQQIQGMNPGTNPFDATGGAGGYTGLSVQQQLSPSTPIYNPQTRAPELLGPQGGVTPSGSMTVPPNVQASRDLMRLTLLKQERASASDPQTAAALDREIAATEGGLSRGGRIQTGPAIGEAENIGGTVASNNADFEETRKSSANAAQDIGVLTNIKKLAPSAITGVGTDRRQLVAGIAGLLGISTEQAEKTDTDLLIKQANMTALGGNTDASRALIAAANPNNHMTKEAIVEAADQVIAQRKMAVEKQRFLAPIKAMGDPSAYQKALSEWNKNADPRILQYQAASPEEKKKLIHSMSESEFKEFRAKAARLHDMGVGQ